MSYATEWAVAFALTQTIEVPIYGVALRRRGWRALPVAFGASLLTHPVIWFVLAPLWTGSYASLIVCAEAFALLAEGLYLRGFGLRRAFGWSLAANLASFTVGWFVL